MYINKYYEPKFEKKIVCLHIEEDKFLKNLAKEYGVSHASISNCTDRFRKECQTNEETMSDYEFMKENASETSAVRTSEGK